MTRSILSFRSLSKPGTLCGSGRISVAIEEIAANEVERAGRRRRRERRKAERQRFHRREHRMVEAFEDHVLHFRRGELRLDVDGDPIVSRVVDETHLIVRRLAGTEAHLDGLTLQDSVRLERHGRLLCGEGPIRPERARPVKPVVEPVVRRARSDKR